MATALAMLAVPGPSGADPVSDVLGGVGDAAEAAPSVPQVTVGGGSLPEVSIGGGGGTSPAPGGGNGGGTSPAPGGGGGSPAPGAQPTTASPATAGGGTSSSPTATGGRGARDASGTDGGTGASRAGARAEQASRSGSGSQARRSGTPAEGGGGITSAANEPAGRGTRKFGGNSLAGRLVSHIPQGFWFLLFAVGAAAGLMGLLALHEARRSRRAQQDALADGLTGLPNRQAFEQRMAREWARATRYGRDLGLLLLDLDGFKQVNDSQGHMAGDRLLREAAAAISSRVRESDLAARLGGDEFVVLCPETAGKGLESLASGLEQCLAEHSVSASVGFAQREPGDIATADVLGRADRCMYERKRLRQEPSGSQSEAQALAAA